MHSAILSQLDYIYFICGFSYLVLSVIVWRWAKQDEKNLPWGLLLFYGVAFGLSQWLEILPLSLGDSPSFAIVRGSLKVGGLLLLLEFSRRSLRSQKGWAPGWWIYPLLAVLAGAGGFAGKEGLNVAAHYVLGFPVVLLVSWFFLRESKTKQALRLTGIALIILGLSVSMFPPSAPFFPASVFNSDTFLNWTGFPIEVARTLCVVMAALGVWLTYARGRDLQPEGRWHRWMLPCITIFCLFGGWWLTYTQGKAADSSARAALLFQAQVIAHTIKPEDIKELAFDATDVENPVYQRLTAQLAAYADLQGFRSVYTMAMRGDEILFGPESLEPDDPWASYPGTVYVQASAEDVALFQDGHPFVEGPYTDEYGTFISALAPVLDPLTGEVLMVVGIDIEAEDWAREVSRVRLLPILLTLTFTFIFLLSLILEFWRLEVGKKPPYNWMCYANMLLTLLAGSSITAFVYKAVTDAEKYDRFERFSSLAETQADVLIESAQEIDEEKLEGLANFFENSEVVTRDEFRKYMEPFARDGSVRRWEWVPAVPASERTGYEAAVQQDGLEGFFIFELDNDGHMLPAAGRDVYYPIFYIEPFEGNEPVMGLDLNSDALASPALDEILHSGLAAATDAFAVDGENTSEYTTLILHPVHGNGTLWGVMGAELNWNALLTYAQAQSYLPKGTLMISILQLEKGEQALVLAGAEDLDASSDVSWFRQQNILYQSVPLFFNGKTYAITVSAGEAFLAANPLHNGWMASGVFALLTLVVAAFIGYLEKRQSDLEQQVSARTAELQESEERARMLIHNAGFPVIVTAMEGNRVLMINERAAQLIGISAEQAVGMQEPDFWVDIKERERLKAELSQNGRVTAYEAQFRSADGQVFWGLLSINLIQYGGERATLILLSNITERRQIEEALRESEARWQFALEGAGDGVWDMNLRENKVYYSRQWKAMLGYEEDEIGNDPLEYDWRVHPDDLARVKEEDRQQLESKGQYYTSEFRMRCKDGSYKWILSRGKIIEWSPEGEPVRVIGTHTDITERKMMEEALRESEGKFRSLFQNNHAVMLLIDPQTSAVVDANRAACAFYGWSLEDFIRQKITDINLLSEQEVKAEMQKALVEKRNYFQFRHILASGEIRDVEVFSGPIEHKGQTLLYSIIHDVTERKKAEEALRVSEERFRLAMESTSDGVWDRDVVSGSTYISPSYCRMLGFEPDEVPVNGLNWLDFVHPDDHDLVYQTDAAIVEGRLDSSEDEFRMRTRDGEWKWILSRSTAVARDSQGRAVRMVGTHIDITERKRAEQALQESEERLRLVMEATRDGLWDWDIKDPMNSYSSPSYHRMLGYEPEEFLMKGDRWINLIHPEDRPHVVRVNDDCAASRMQSFEMEFRMKAKDGEWKWILSRGKAVAWDSEGKTVRMVGTHMDITERKQAEEALRASEERFRLAMEATSDGLYDANIVTGERYFSPGYFRMLGYEPGEFPETVEAWQEHMHPDDRMYVNWLNTEYIENRSSTLEGVYRLRAKNGEWRWILGRAKAVTRDVNGRAIRIIGTQMDITESKQMDEALRQSEQNFATFFGTVEEFLFVLGMDGKILKANQTVCQRLGYLEEELVGQEIAFVHPPELRQQAREIIGQMPEGKISEYLIPLMTRDGRYIPVETHVTASMWNGQDALYYVSKDLTELKRSEEKFSRVFRSSAVLMAVSDLETGKFVDVNEAFLNTMGYRREEIIGHTSEEIILFVNISQRAEIIALAKEKGSLRDVEVDMYTRGGQIRHGLFTVDVISLEGKPHLLTSMLDITERKQAEEMLRASQKYAELGTLAAGVAHELNTPLQIVTGSADSLLKQIEQPDTVNYERVRRYLENISRNSWRMANIVRTLNIYARQSKEEMESYAINELVQDTLLLIEHQLNAWSSIRVELDLGEGIPNIRCNRNDITQVLINLMTNARDAMPHGGKILISSRYLPDADSVRLDVGDTGAGIPANIQKRIFDPFFTTKPIDRGTGLGLSIVQGIIHNYGGHIELTSAPGEGTTFHLFFPCNPSVRSIPEGNEQIPGRYSG